jgi:hypothetical protein
MTPISRRHLTGVKILNRVAFTYTHVRPLTSP